MKSRISLIAVVVLLAWCIPSAIAKPRTQSSAFVWVEGLEEELDVAMELGQSFETALVRRGCFQLLDRQELHELIAHTQTEIDLQMTEGREEILDRQIADAYIDYEIYDDKERGVVVVSATVKSLDSRLLASGRVVFSPRGAIHSESERSRRMKQLAAKLCKRRQVQSLGRDWKFWTGVGATVLAGAITLDRNSEIKAAVDNLDSLPRVTVEEQLEFNRQLASYEGLQDDRDLANTTTIVLGAGTLAYMIHRKLANRQQLPKSFKSRTTNRTKWLLGMDRHSITLGISIEVPQR